MSEENKISSEAPESTDRRAFLAKASRFAVATPAAVTVLLSTSMEADAGVMKSVGDKYKHGHKHKHHHKHKNHRKYKILERLMGRW